MKVWLYRANVAFLGLSGIAVLAMDLVVLWAVLTRYALNSPSTWAFPTVSYLLLLVVFLGASGTLQRDRHVRIDALVNNLPPRAGKVVRQLGDFLGIVFVGVFCVESVILFHRSLESGTRDVSTLRLPLVWTQWILVAGGALMLVTYMVRWIENWREREAR